MNTTSLEMSRKLDAAGFWDRETGYVERFYRKRNGKLYHIDDEFYYIDADTPAATLDDLVAALGLDKLKNFILHDKIAGMVFPAKISWAIDQHGLTPDVLAQVWLDTNTNPEDDE